jgi:peroxiredoxin Q/BCP
MGAAAKKTTTSNWSIGDKAPSFSMQAEDGSILTLKDFIGKKHVVLYFYPKDDTPGCTVEAKEFRDHADAFETAGAVIIGVSKDSIQKHCKFIEKHALNFHLGSDENGTVCEDYGVWVEKNMYGKKYMGIARETFLIAKDGTIAAHWPKVKPAGHAEAVLEALHALQ